MKRHPFETAALLLLLPFLLISCKESQNTETEQQQFDYAAGKNWLSVPETVPAKNRY